MHLIIKSSSLFLIFFYLNVFCKGIGLSNDSFIYTLLLFVGILFLVLKFIASRYNKRDIILMIIFISIGAVSFLTTKKPTLMLTCLCFAGMKNLDIEQVFKGMYRIRLVTFVLVVGLSLIGIIENTSITMWRNGHFDVRYSLGFGHPNSLHLAFFVLSATYLYVHFTKLNIWKYLIVVLANFFIYSYSGSRTGLVGVFVLVFLIYVAHSKSTLVKKVLCSAPRYVFLVLTFASFILSWLYGKVGFVTALDVMLNGRLSYSNHFITNYGVSLFGHSLVGENALFDNGYLFLYIQFGIVGIVLIGGLIYLICKNVKRSMDVRDSALLLIFLIYIFTESFSPNIFMNIILLFAYPIIYLPSSYRKSVWR